MEDKKEKKRKSKEQILTQPGNGTEEAFLDEVIAHVRSKLKSGKYQVKIADAIRAIEVKQKSKGQKKSKEKIFWELIDQIRKEELPE